ncbi:MAG: pyridoxal phosphate-dependent decarboxylase family protein, partial [Bacteroidota bacterium]
PVASLIEKEMISMMNSYIGYHQGDGIFLSGGSNANLVAMFSARNKVSPHSRFEGYDKRERLVAFVNEHSHYSFDTAANLLGIGSSNLIKVKTDASGRIIPAELERSVLASIEAGQKPFFIGATCSTTMQGAYDPLHAIADIAEKFGVWFHADGAFGGSIILSDKHKHMMDGIERTDSFAWDPHKLMNIPLICSVILTKRKGVLENNLTDINTDYIYHNNEEMTDLGEKSIQCGRHVDAVKLWFAWKYYGKIGYDRRIANMIDMARYAEEIVKNHPELEMVSPRQSFTVCFRYRPPFEANLDEFNFMVREKLRREGKSMVNYGYVNDQMTIRFVASNGDLEKKDIDKFFDYFWQSAQKCIDEYLEKNEA